MLRRDRKPLCHISFAGTNDNQIVATPSNPGWMPQVLSLRKYSQPHTRSILLYRRSPINLTSAYKTPAIPYENRSLFPTRLIRSSMQVPAIAEAFMHSLLPIMVIAVVAITGRRYLQRKRLPGPPGLPLLGNIFQLGKFPWLKFTEWSQIYGTYMYRYTELPDDD